MKLTKRTIAIIIAIIIVVLAILGGLVYAKTDIFKTPKELFYKYLLIENKEFSYDEFLENYKNSIEKTYSSNGEISLDIKSDTSSQEIFDKINKVKFTFEEKNLPSEKKMYSKFNIKYDDKDAIEASVVKNENIYGIKSELFHDKYITIENNNLKELAEKLGMDEDSIPNKFEEVNMYDILYISKEERSRITKKYKEVIDNAISKEKYTVKKNVEIDVDNEKIKTNAYQLKLTEKEFLNIVKSILETAKEDDQTLELLVSKYENISKNITEKEEITKESIKESIEDAIEEIEDEIDYIDDDENNEMTITVYNNKGKTIKTEIKVEDVTISVEKYQKDNKNYIILKTNEDDEEYKITIEYIAKKENGSKSIEGTIKLSGDEDASIDFNINVTGKLGKSKNEIVATLKTDIEDNEITINIKQNIDYDAKVEIETLNEENATILNELNEEELKELFENIYKKLEKELPEKIEELGLDKIFEQKKSLYDDYDFEENEDINYEFDYDNYEL